jgi:hypothetical protein
MVINASWLSVGNSYISSPGPTLTHFAPDPNRNCGLNWNWRVEVNKALLLRGLIIKGKMYHTRVHPGFLFSHSSRAVMQRQSTNHNRTGPQPSFFRLNASGLVALELPANLFFSSLSFVPLRPGLPPPVFIHADHDARACKTFLYPPLAIRACGTREHVPSFPAALVTNR